MSCAGIINFIYNEPIVSRALPSSSVDYNWYMGINYVAIYKSHDSYINSCVSIVIDWWRGQSRQNYSLVINKIYNSSTRSPLIKINSATLGKK